MKQFVLFIMLFSAVLFSHADSRVFQVEVEGKGQAIILLPGLNSSSEVWDEAVSRLKPHYQTHAINLVGFAGVPLHKEEGAPDFSRISKALAEYIRREKLKKAIVVGHSLGGVLAMKLAAQHPDLVDRLVIVDSLPFLPLFFNPMATPESMLPMAEQIKKSSLALTSPDAKRNFYQSSIAGMAQSKQNQEKIIQWSVESDNKMTAASMFELYTTDLRPELKKIQAPALVLASWSMVKNFGWTKENVKKHYEMQYQNIAELELMVHDSAMHFVMLDAPTWTYDNMLGFVKK